MANSKSSLQILIELETKNQKALREVAEGLEKINKQGGDTTRAFGDIVKGNFLAQGAFKVLTGILNHAQAAMVDFGAATEEAAKGIDLQRGFIRNFGTDIQKNLDVLRVASKNTISDLDLMQTANRASLLGVTDSVEDLAGLMLTARLRGKEMGLTTTQAFSDIVTGIGRGSPLILDNLGIKIPDAFKETAESMGSAEKTIALTNLVIEDGSNIAKEYGGDLLTASDRMAIVDAASLNLRNSIGLLGVAFNEGANTSDTALGVLTAINDIISQLEPYIRALGNALANTLSVEIEKTTFLMSGFTGETMTSEEMLTGLFGVIAQVGSALIQGLGFSIRTVMGLVMGFIELGNKWMELLYSISAANGKLAQNVMNSWTGLRNSLVILMTGIANGVSLGFANAANAAISSVNKILGAMAPLSKFLYETTGLKIPTGISGTMTAKTFSTDDFGGIQEPLNIAKAVAKNTFSVLTLGLGGENGISNSFGLSPLDSLFDASGGTAGIGSPSSKGGTGGGAGSDLEKEKQEALRVMQELERARIESIADEKQRLIEAAKFKAKKQIEDYNLSKATENQKAEYSTYINENLRQELKKIEDEFRQRELDELERMEDEKTRIMEDKEKDRLARIARIRDAQDEIDRLKAESIVNKDQRQKALLELEYKNDIRDFSGPANLRNDYIQARTTKLEQDLFRAGLTSGFATPTVANNPTQSTLTNNSSNLSINITGNSIDSSSRIDEIIKKIKNELSRENKLAQYNFSFG